MLSALAKLALAASFCKAASPRRVPTFVFVTAASAPAAAAAVVNFAQPATTINVSTIPTDFTVPCSGVDCVNKTKDAFFATLVVVRGGGWGKGARQSCRELLAMLGLQLGLQQGNEAKRGTGKH